MLKIKGYNIYGKVAEQGAVHIYKALQESLNRLVTLKVLQSKLSNVGEIRDFVQEARSAATFKHPHVLEVYDVGEEEGTFYVSQEYVEGHTVRELMGLEGPIPARRALKIAHYVADALNAAWMKDRILHRDISPDNIIVTSDGFVKLAGLGQVRPTNISTLDIYIQAGIISDSLNYASPEQALETKNPDLRSDMYSLGATFYHMVTGEIPFKAATPIESLQMRLKERLRHPREINKQIPPSTAVVIAKLMMIEPSNRYSNWEAVISDITKASKGQIVTIKQGWEQLSSIKPLSGEFPQKFSGHRKNVPAWIRGPMTTLVILWLLFVIYALFQKEITNIFGKFLPENAITTQE